MSNEMYVDTLDPPTKHAVRTLALAPTATALRYFLEVKPNFPFTTLEKEKELLFLQRFPVETTTAVGTQIEMRIVYRVIEKNPSFPGDPAAHRLIAIGDMGDCNRVRERFKEFIITAFAFLPVYEMSKKKVTQEEHMSSSKRSGALPNIAQLRKGSDSA